MLIGLHAHPQPIVVKFIWGGYRNSRPLLVDAQWVSDGMQGILSALYHAPLCSVLQLLPADSDETLAWHAGPFILDSVVWPQQQRSIRV